jgi:thiamine-phosphate pyrophosphorylase
VPPLILADGLLLTLVIGRENALGKNLKDLILSAFQGGATALQLREKTLEDRAFYEEALMCAELCRREGRLFIVNNRADIALAAGADGVHLGEGDLPLEAARELLPPPKIIGFSASSREKGEEALEKGADYLGVGAIYPSPSKKDAMVLDQERVRELVKLPLPTVGIGGVSLKNAREAWSMGFTGLAVISAVAGADDPRRAAEALLSLRGRTPNRAGSDP